MSKLEDRENRRKSSVIGTMVDKKPAAASGKKGRPKVEDRELKKRVSLSVLPSLYQDIQKIAYVQRRSVSDIVGEQLERYRKSHTKEMQSYAELDDPEK